MNFNSQIFLYLFFPTVILFAAVLPRLLIPHARTRTWFSNSFLFLASLLFYFHGEPVHIQLLLGSILVNYWLGLAAGICHKRNISLKYVIAATLIINLGVLAYFKYANFFAQNYSLLRENLGLSAYQIKHIHLPIGISFFTFQAMSYVIDVCRKDIPVERNFLKFGLYISLFPQMVAGPIVRYSTIAAQVSERTIRFEQFSAGLKRFIVGLAKKILLADSLAQCSDAVFSYPADELGSSAICLALVCYTLQIYYDFSGYSDMAIGLGKMLGFDFLENFNYPYISQSITEFWRRWHISLSTWFRDYLYIPLGGNRDGALSTYRNLFIVFFLCGLWHGASWTFIAWGIFHGLFLIIERLGLGKLLLKLPAVIRHSYALFVVMIGWLLFRSNSIEQAWQMLISLFTGSNAASPYLAKDFVTDKILFILPIAIISSLPIVPWVQSRLHERKEKNIWWNLGELLLQALVAAFLVFVFVNVMIQLAGRTFSPFIYFRF